MLQVRAAIVAAALVTVPLGAQAADLVVWWNKGFYEQEDEAIREIIAAFEQETGKEVELVLVPQEEMRDKAETALELGRPPHLLWGTLSFYWVPEWAYEGRLVDLEDALGSNVNLFDADAIDLATLFNGRTGRRGLYALPVGRVSNHLHVWNSLLERAGFTLADIRSNGIPSGPSGATRCRPGYVRPWVEMTFEVSAAQEELQDRAQVALEAGHPPDFLFGFFSARILPQ